MRVLMCCSDLSYKGGMVSVVRGYLKSPSWPARTRITFVPTHREASKAGLIWTFAKAWMRVLRLASRGLVNVAHLHVAERGSFVRKALLMKLLHFYHVPVVLHHHGAEFDTWYASRSPRMKRWISSVLAEADLNLVLSRRLTEMITSKAPGARVATLYNAVDVPAANPYSLSARGVLMLGRLGERKGVYDLLKAIKKIDGEVAPDVKFYLCGDGEVERVKERVAELGIGHRIAHIGWIDGEQKERILADTMINILPSYHEGLPMTILETMARGIPNISTPVASIPEVITDGETGLLVRPGDVDAIAAAILRLAADPSLRRTISDASYRLIASRFSLPAAITRLSELYQQLLLS